MSKEDPMIGRVLARTISIRRKIGAGGMGNVYEGYQEHLNRAVAVKVMTPEHARNPVAAEYFLREARAASQLRHPNIIQIIDFGAEDDDTVFIAMEYVPGKPLSRLIRHEFPLPSERIIKILDQTLSGLAEAHRKEFVHRDLKPDNLMIEEIDGDDFVKVLDFGIAQSQSANEEAGPLTQAGAVVGTPQYMSPEQATAKKVDGRSDLFSLGIILYEMLTQKTPFRGKSLPEILIAVLKEDPQPPSAFRPDLTIDPKLEAICLRALKKDRALRFQSADEFRDALRGLDKPQPTAPAQAFIFKRSAKAEAKAPTEQVVRESPAPTPRVPAAGRTMNVSLEPIDGTVPDRTVPDPTMPDSTVPDRGVALQDAAVPTDPLAATFSVEDLAGGLLSERASVTALVLHQRSHTRIDPEAMADLRVALDRTMEEVATEWRGQVTGRQGAFLTILFGIPAPSPDDVFRSVQAALALRLRLREVAPAGTVFSYALSSGEIYCPSGELSHASGPPLDEATESARGAGDDNIVIADEVLATRVSTMFRLGPEDDQGHRPVLGVLDASRQAMRAGEGDRKGVELIGRDPEIAMLLAAFGRLSKGRGTLFAVTGEPGVGKTAMISEAVKIAEQRDIRAIHARWFSEGAEAIRSIRLQWLTHFLSQQGYLVREAFSAFREVGLEPEYSRLLSSFIEERLEEAFGFVGRARRTPEGEMRAEVALRVAFKRLSRCLSSEQERLVVVLDNVNRGSDAYHEVLTEWAETCADLPVLFITGTRSDENLFVEVEGPTEEMALLPLDERASLAFLKVRLPSTMAADVIARLARIGAGYPVHLEHLARFARGRNFDVERADQLLAETRDIAELLRMRVYEQPKTHQNVLAVFAGLGDGVYASSLFDLCPTEWGAEEIVTELVEDGLLDVSGETENPRLHFRPSTLEGVIYDRLSRKMRKQIHDRARGYYEERIRASREKPSRDDLLALARHRELAGDIGGAHDVLTQLASSSFREHDYDAATDVLERAIRLLESQDKPATQQIARHRLQLARAERAVGRTSDALDRCRRLYRQQDIEPKLAVEIQIELANMWLEDEDPDLVGKIARTALTTVRKLHGAEPDDDYLSCLLIMALQLSAEVLARQGKLAQAMEFALEAAGIIERGEVLPLDNPVGPELVWGTLTLVARIRVRLNELPGARKILELARRVVTECGDVRGQIAVAANMSAVHAQLGDIERGYKEVSDALRLARQLGAPHVLARLEFNRGLILRRQRRLEMALQAFETSAELAEDLDWREGIAQNAVQLDQLRALLDKQEGRP